ncbi:hypothetical protein Pelo_3354 [Pelomyxa schiedti]|nr:hypothetical protein Pelo_3354 [Pelomyxa schiedti]
MCCDVRPRLVHEHMPCMQARQDPAGGARRHFKEEKGGMTKPKHQTSTPVQIFIITEILRAMGLSAVQASPPINTNNNLVNSAPQWEPEQLPLCSL